MATLWTNADGLVVKFGRQDVAGGVNERPVVRHTNRSGLVQELVVDFDFNHLGSAETAAPTEWWDQDAGSGDTPDTPSGIHAFLPNGCFLRAARLLVKTAFTTGDAGALNLGLYQSDATAIDVDGIDSAIAAASLTDGAIITCDGADVGTLVGANDAYIGAHASTGGFTAGAARLVVEFELERDT